MFDLIAIPLGWVMWAIYQVVHNYGISLVLFTLFIKLLTLPSTYKMQVNTARMGLIAPKIEKIKKSYPNNPQRVQEEQTKFYGQEGINPGSGCLGSLVTMLLLFGVYRVVLRPLTHILHISNETLSQAQTALQTWLDQNHITEKYLTARPELIMLKYAKSNPEAFSGIEGFADKLRGFENNFLGFDLTGTPDLHPEVWSKTALLLIALPVLAAIAQLAITIVTQIRQKKVNPNMQSMGGMNAMLYASPLMTVWIGMSTPAGLSLYWLVNSILSLVMMVLIYKYLDNKERLLAINEKEKQKQLKKGPGFMQRMMEQSAQMQAQQNGTNNRGEANRTRYADGDDGMTRKERAEYERKLVEAARRRAAEKYGEELPESDPGDDDL